MKFPSIAVHAAALLKQAAVLAEGAQGALVARFAFFFTGQILVHRTGFKASDALCLAFLCLVLAHGAVLAAVQWSGPCWLLAELARQALLALACTISVRKLAIGAELAFFQSCCVTVFACWAVGALRTNSTAFGKLTLIAFLALFLSRIRLMHTGSAECTFRLCCFGLDCASGAREAVTAFELWAVLATGTVLAKGVAKAPPF